MYYIDFKKMSLSEYAKKLESADMIPSRMLLKEKIKERFDYFAGMGITNVYELQQLLKKKILSLSNEKLFSEEYLTVLLREINSLQPKPNKLNEFSIAPKDIIIKLEKAGINNTVSLYEYVLSKKSRKEFAKNHNISEKDLLLLTKLTDLSRIRWVGSAFAQVLYLVGFDSVEKVAAADYKELYQKISLLNKEKQYYKGNIGEHDMKLTVLAAREVELEIEY